MTAPTRIYAVTNRETGFEHLIRATNQAQAVRHAARNQFTVDVATQDQLVELVAAGVKVEDSSEMLAEKFDGYVMGRLVEERDAAN